MSTEILKSSRTPTALQSLSSLIVLPLVLGVVIFSGCQKSDSQTREITEEISSPVEPSEQTDLAKEPETSPLDAEATSDSSMESSSQTSEPVASSETPKSANTDAESAKEKKPTGEKPDGKKPDEKKMVDDDAGPENQPASTTPSTEDSENASSEEASKIVSLQAEMDRQNREKLLGLNQDSVAAEPREIKLLVKEREFTKESKHDAWRVTFDDIDLLKTLNMEPVPLNAEDYLPDWLTALQGQKIILRGWMFPPDESEGIRRFMFVRDNQICCFGRKAKVYDKLWVKLQDGETSKYIQGRPFDLVGTFKIESWPEDERDEKTGEFVETLGLLYHIDDATIIQK
ncbi:hypothetical protein [Thalassoglobus polymorphus]|uniref:Uncharacterized protein n=1 Tax=Thalassoglobus polymorphus TaxID=2527994 RepID=A0A517QM80_9PLAN|nr:hypothetical protein [Thalassoglobus polymorphus]QDT32711.1 hypothetical protein Mal48_19580 [Thalassoglobus polymorphus]